MRKNNRLIGITLSFCLALLLILPVFSPIISFADENTVYISSTEEFLSFAKNCSYNQWSVDKNIVLNADISLEGLNFEPIASFSGSFDGQGHTISGLNISGAYAPAGLFARIEDNGSVKNLTVSGSVTPDGEKSYVGGIAGDNRGVIENCVFMGSVIGAEDVGCIAGINRISGSIADCSSRGEVVGENRTGGIAGTNLGIISSSENKSKVNTISVTPSVTLDDLNALLSFDLTRLPTISNGTRNDTGGIAGYSSGIIVGCKNQGETGYAHIGYNVGGIAGRSCGHLSGNENFASVSGRKDVGGIVGQVEPYVSYEITESLIATLKGELDGLYDLINNAADSVDGTSETITSRLDSIIGLIGNASDSLEIIVGELTDWGNGTIKEFNRISTVLGKTLDKLALITDQLPALSRQLTTALSSLELCVRELEDVNVASNEVISALNLSLESLEGAISLLGKGAEQIKSGIVLVADAIESEDSAEVKSALTQVVNGSANIAGALGIMASATYDIGEALGNITSGSESFATIGDAFERISTALLGLSDGMKDISDGIGYIGENVTVNVEIAFGGIKLIADGISDLISSSVELEESISHLRDALTLSDTLSDELSDVITHLGDTVGALEKASDLGTEVLLNVDGLVDYLAGVKPVQIPTLSKDLTSEADKLFTTITSLETNLSQLNGEIHGASAELTELVRKANDLFSNMMDTVIDEIYGIADFKSSIDKTVTPEEVDSVTNGKIFDCTNNGKVYGDKNVGGIGGIIAIEYTVDPEDDLSYEIDPMQKRQYQLKAVIQSCTNLGSVTSKLDFAGGITGKADFGLIYECESYCKVSSETGSYVGGIAGMTAADVNGCFAKASLAGKKYVGGIIGCGVSEDLSADSSLISNCYSIPHIESCKQYGGAISGYLAGEFDNNFFLSDSLHGIDRVSYHGKATPISYKDLMKHRTAPIKLYNFTLEFVADGEVIASYEFEYGASFDQSIFPAIPAKDGYYSYWDRDSLENLTFDTTVNAVYHRYVGALGSDETREDGRDVIIVEGSFTENDRLVISSGNVNTDSLLLSNGLFTIPTVSESYLISIPADGVSNTIRYLPDGGKCDIYLKENGVWTKLDTDKFGSYLIFDVHSDNVEFAVVSYSANILGIIITVFVCTALAVAIALPIIFRNRIKEKMQENKEKKRNTKKNK